VAGGNGEILAAITNLGSRIEGKVDRVGSTVSDLRVDVARIESQVKGQGREIGELKSTQQKADDRLTSTIPETIKEAVREHRDTCPGSGREDATGRVEVNVSQGVAEGKDGLRAALWKALPYIITILASLAAGSGLTIAFGNDEVAHIDVRSRVDRTHAVVSE